MPQGCLQYDPGELDVQPHKEAAAQMMVEISHSMDDKGSCELGPRRLGMGQGSRLSKVDCMMSQARMPAQTWKGMASSLEGSGRQLRCRWPRR